MTQISHYRAFIQQPNTQYQTQRRAETNWNVISLVCDQRPAKLVQLKILIMLIEESQAVGYMFLSCYVTY